MSRSDHERSPVPKMWHTKYVSRSGHERSPVPKIFFSGMPHMIYSHFCMYNSKVEAILQSDSMQVNNREGSGQHRVTLGQIFDYYCMRNLFFWTSLISDSKNVIFYVRCLEMLKIVVWKNDVINGYGFWALCLPKNRYINLEFGMPHVQAWFYNILNVCLKI